MVKYVLEREDDNPSHAEITVEHSWPVRTWVMDFPASALPAAN